MVLACAFWSSQGNNSLNVFDHKTLLLLISCKVWSQMSCMWSIGMNVFDIIYSLMENIHNSPLLCKLFKNPKREKKIILLLHRNLERRMLYVHVLGVTISL